MDAILILGGGIAGLSAAIALRLGTFEPVAYERRPLSGGGGAGLVFWSNASFALNELGVLAGLVACMARGWCSGLPTSSA